MPGTRGREQSSLPKDIKREMLALGEAGYKEVTLLGQNIDAYGRDLPGMAADGSGRRANTLTDLLYEVHDVPGIERIRFVRAAPARRGGDGRATWSRDMVAPVAEC